MASLSLGEEPVAILEHRVCSIFVPLDSDGGAEPGGLYPEVETPAPEKSDNTEPTAMAPFCRVLAPVAHIASKAGNRIWIPLRWRLAGWFMTSR